MSRSRRHAVVIVPRPEGWNPQVATDLPAPFVQTAHVSLGHAAELARKFNEAELACPTGRWAIAAKGLKLARPKTPKAPSIADIEGMLSAAGGPEFDRDVLGIHLGRLLTAYILVSFDTGLRLTDLVGATWYQLDGTGTLAMKLPATGHLALLRLHPQTVGALESVRVHDDDRLLPWPAGRRALVHQVRHLMRCARKGGAA
jgi:integrase